jgi:hypothetical protein
MREARAVKNDLVKIGRMDWILRQYSRNDFRFPSALDILIYIYLLPHTSLLDSTTTHYITISIRSFQIHPRLSNYQVSNCFLGALAIVNALADYC